MSTMIYHAKMFQIIYPNNIAFISQSTSFPQNPNTSSHLVLDHIHIHTSIDTLINKIDSIFIPKSNHIKYPFKLLLISLLLNNSFKCTSSKSHAVVDRDSCIIFKIRLRITFFFVKLRQTIVGLSNLMQSLNSQPENPHVQ